MRRDAQVLQEDAQQVASLLERYVAAQVAGDRRAALRLVVDEGLASGVPLSSLYLDVIQAAQYRIGELWQANRISVAQEHLATAISQIAVAELYRALECEPSNGKRALVSCVGGELHELGTRITADFFEMAGFDVRYLGANVPTDTLLGMVREDPPDLLVLSVTMSFHVDALRAAVRGSREASGDRLRLAVGGHAFTWAPGLVEELGAEVFGRNATESIARARDVLELGAA
jgi:MerR family transcriptional regulator, light-induced transcriptional regulator